MPPSGQPAFPPQAQYQPQQVLQPQAAPVSPVAFPASPYTGPQPAQQAVPNPAQVLARQLIELARTLEQLIPGYQIAQSILLDMGSAPASSQEPGLDEALRDLREALHYHGASLGAIRRILCGETTPAVLTNLATAFHALREVHTRSGAVLDRLVPTAPLPLRAALANLAPSLSAADALLAQAATTVQALVGPQIWEASRAGQAEKGMAGAK